MDITASISCGHYEPMVSEAEFLILKEICEDSDQNFSKNNCS